MRLTRLLLWAIVVAVIGTGGVVLLQVLMEPFPIEVGRILASGIAVVLYLALALACAMVREHGRARWLMLSGIIVGAVALVGWLLFIWFVDRSPLPEETWLKVLAWPTTWACLAMVIGLLLLPRRRRGWWVGLRRATIGALLLLAVHICFSSTLHPGYDSVYDELQWSKVRQYEEITARITGVLTLLAAGGVATTFLLLLAPQFSGGALAEERSRRYWFRCPRCGREQELATGLAHCARCGLRIKVELP